MCKYVLICDTVERCYIDNINVDSSYVENEDKLNHDIIRKFKCYGLAC